MPIIRNIVFVAVAVMLIPSPPEDASVNSMSDLATPGLIAAASHAVSDIGDFCGRQPGVCETAQYVAGKLELKAKYGVKLLYEWANEAGSGELAPQIHEADGSDALMTGSLRLAAGDTGESTLKIDDLVPEWRQPNVAPREG